MSCILTNQAQRRYLWRFFTTMALYILAFALVDRYFHHSHPTGALAIALATLPALPILASIAVAGLYIAEEQDEFIRMLFVRSILMGIGATLAITTVVGFLQVFEIIHPFPIYQVFAIFWVMTGLAQGGNQVFYRGRNE
jgi:hypothetical protein